jgi:molybdopterin-guanine dinucleotide biosynthesis protein
MNAYYIETDTELDVKEIKRALQDTLKAKKCSVTELGEQYLVVLKDHGWCLQTTTPPTLLRRQKLEYLKSKYPKEEGFIQVAITEGYSDEEISTYITPTKKNK